MKNLVAFFSRIPVKGDIEKARNEVWLLPLLGLLLSLIPSLIFYFSSLIIRTSPVKGLISILSLYLIIGIIHLDGLADFFDGLMAKGDRTEKIKVMKSPDTGVAGVFAMLAVMLIQIFSLNSFPAKIFWIIGLAEVNSKMSIVLMLQNRNFLDGIGKFFSEAMDFKGLFLSGIVYVLCLIVIFVLGRSLFTFISIICFLVPIYITRIALKNFGGLNGDCIGASVELTRAVTLLMGVLYWLGLSR
ncbi:MAG: adenosylcobinamide-GDP ribazoletransferase [Archaeoglobus sp.]|nr:adenosylcobinamide-GDP ribazoletransferase [Archaeoglobus sp.]